MQPIRTYRAKMLDKPDTWVYGYYVWSDELMRGFIYTTEQGLHPNSKVLKQNEVDPKTVGQCTGRKDKNGTWIYEGDKVVNRTHKWSSAEYEIRWYNTGWIGWSKEGDEYGPYTLNLYINDKNPILERIGNIHE